MNTFRLSLASITQEHPSLGDGGNLSKGTQGNEVTILLYFYTDGSTDSDGVGYAVIFNIATIENFSQMKPLYLLQKVERYI